MIATYVNCVIRLIKLITAIISTQACNLCNHLCQDGQTCCQSEILGYCQLLYRGLCKNISIIGTWLLICSWLAIGVTKDHILPEILSTLQIGTDTYHLLENGIYVPETAIKTIYHLFVLQLTEYSNLNCAHTPTFSLRKGCGESVHAHSCNVEWGRGAHTHSENKAKTGLLYHASTTATQKCPINTIKYQLSYDKLQCYWSHASNVTYNNIAHGSTCVFK